MVILILAISSVHAEANDTQDDVKLESKASGQLSGSTLKASKDTSFTGLQNDIKKSNKKLNLNSDYQKIKSDSSDGVVINKSNIIIDGCGHTINAKASSRIFDIYGRNVTLQNMILANGDSSVGSAIYINPNADVKTVNVTFRGCQSTRSGTVFVEYANYTSVNDKIYDCRSAENGIISSSNSKIVIKNAYMRSKFKLQKGFVASLEKSVIDVTGSTFENTKSKYSTAIWADSYLNVENSSFINLQSDLTAGAISAKDVKNKVNINKCIFKNVTSTNNAGAIFIDIEGISSYNTTARITSSNFTKCRSNFGGAILQTSGKLIVDKCNFIDNRAVYSGGAIYTSNADVTIQKSLFEKNKVILSDYDANALFVDRGPLSLRDSTFNSNTGADEAVYLYDVKYNIVGNTFNSNKNAVYAVFSSGNIKDNKLNKDKLSLNNTDYATYVDEVVDPLKIVNSNKKIYTYPLVYDYRQLGYVTSVKNQNSKSSCWSFGAIAALESSVAKATGQKVDLSENVIFNSMLKYSKFGENDTSELASLLLPIGSFISWLGTYPSEYDEFDELSKISEYTSTESNVHVQDVLILDPLRSADNINIFKQALYNYGGIAVEINAKYNNNTLYNPKTGCFYAPKDIGNNHVVCIVGWDDTIRRDNFPIRPPGDGAWIVKNSFGPKWADNGYYYISYYDKVLLNRLSYCFILNNTISYNKVYQTDISGCDDNYLTPNSGNIIHYVNKFNMTDDDYIAAIGTYFNKKGVKYEIRIIVNDYIKLVQKGASSHYGYSTIKLDKYVPVKKNDQVIVEVISNAVPVQLNSRQHYMTDVSLYAVDGKNWSDLIDRNATVCLKLYTVDKSSIKVSNNNKKSTKNGYKATFYDGYGQILKNSNVSITINGKKYDTTTNELGVASVDTVFDDEEYNITLYNPETGEEWLDFLDFDDDEYVPASTQQWTRDLTGKNYNSHQKRVSSAIKSKTYPNINVNANNHKSIHSLDDYRAVFYDKNDMTLKNTEVIFIIDGKEYRKVTDEKGIAVLDDELSPGIHQVTIINPVTGENITYTINVGARIIENHDVESPYNGSTIFKVRLVDENANPVSAGERVIFKVDDIPYEVKSDENGYASIMINNTVEDKNITATYAGYTTTNKITVNK